MLRKIALEEHFLPPGLIDYWTPSVADIDPAAADHLFRSLTDFGDMRLDAMDAAGIERAVLSVGGAGVQAEPVVATAVRKASEANDFLAREIRKRPQAYLGFAHLPMQDPAAAARELERCRHDLDLSGALIHGHSQGHYLDEPAFDVFWECAEALEAPVFLHRADPVVPAPVLAGYRALRGEGWEQAFETGSHVLRLVFGGVFERFPKLRLMLANLGDALPYMLAGFDRAADDSAPLAALPSAYFRNNIFVTTSGAHSAEALYCAVAALGPEHVLFGTGYPFEPAETAAQFIDGVRLDETLRAAIAYRNAEALLGL